MSQISEALAANETKSNEPSAKERHQPYQPLNTAGFPNQPSGFYKALPATLDNVQHLLTGYGLCVSYDAIKKKLTVKIPSANANTDNYDNTAITTICSLAALNNIQVGQVPALVEALADRNSENPVADWIRSKPWDDQDRVTQIIQTLTVREGYPETLKAVLIRKWLLSAVAAALTPKGFKARGVLTLQGPQGIGKTSWIRSLVNHRDLSEQWIKVDHHLDPHDKDSILGAMSHWIVEIGELDSSFRKSDVARLKGVLTGDADKVRRPYARTESEYPRRTIFAATVNEESFLVDSTGNTRWWTLPLVAIEYQHQIDMQQVFAQLAQAYDQKEIWWLTREEEDSLEAQNQEHRVVSILRTRLMEQVDFSADGTQKGQRMGTMKILQDLGYDKPTNGDCKELTALLRELVGEGKKVKGTLTWVLHWREAHDRETRYSGLP